ncbi:MAG: hypothetical protein AAGJ46_00945 [Planctomycetota bacterium]
MRPLCTLLLLLAASSASFAQEPVNVGFLWHMHQPIYYPGESIAQTDAAGRFSFSVTDVHNQRFGPYTSWPQNAINAGNSLPHLGAQVSFSGSLMENLNTLEGNGTNGGMWNNWENSYRQAASQNTSLGNSRLDLVGFGYHHPLMPLLDERDMRMQIRLHKHAHEQTWGPNVPYSKGIFPAETAFSARMIPALKAEGLEWAIFDSIHLERAVENYPHTPASNLYPPNRADQINPALPDEQWVQLGNLWAPSKVAAPFAYRPHYTQHVDPATGQIEKIVAVPAARYEGNEDGRGGFGALQYEQVMSQYRHLNTDPNHPMFVLLHHDGDNFGGGSEAYYNGNFQNMVNWAQNTPDYDVTTVQDYLDRFPPNPNDVVHIESGSWAGADNGDPEFKKWLGDPDPPGPGETAGWSPDRNSWAVLTAAKNRVYTAHDLQLGGPETFPNMQNVMTGTGSATERAWHYLLQAQASDHWYWDGTEIWDSNVTRGSNLAAAQADTVLANFGQGSGPITESTPPTVFLPQREAYNPGGLEWGPLPEDSDFEVWTYAYDVSGLESVNLMYRIDADGVNPLGSTQNETYAGGAEVGDWISIAMTSSDTPPPSGILGATYRALRYGADIEGVTDSLVDYYVEAVDSQGNIQRSDIQHVYVGAGSVVGTDRVTLSPDPPIAGDSTLVSFDPAGGPLSDADSVLAHVGYNGWSIVQPQDTLLTWDASEGRWSGSVPIDPTATELNLVFNNGGGVWDNNGGADWAFAVDGGEPGIEFVMDGQLDEIAEVAATADGQTLHWAVDGNRLYLATEDAGEGADVFIYVSDTPGDPTDANWAKAGAIAEWDAFLADENDNDFEGWFDAPAGAQAATGENGGVLEGVIDLAALFGAMPEEVHVAVAMFATGDGGELLSVLMDANGDGNVDASEYLRLVLAPSIDGDYNGDGVVDMADFTVWRDSLNSTSNLAADGNGDGVVNVDDFRVWRENFGSGAASAGVVPEPGSVALLAVIAAASMGRGPATRRRRACRGG